MLLITGATGLSGSMVVAECARQNVSVRALVRNRAKAAAIERLPGVEIVEGDMARPETLGRALDGVERALLISTANREMTETQCRFVDACKSAGVRHVVKLSGAEPEFDREQFLFTRMHAEIERHLESSGLRWTHLLPSQFMQVYLREAPSIVAEGAFYLPLGTIELAPIDIADIAAVACKLLRDGGHAGQSYAMTGPEALTMADIAERLSEASGRAVRYVAVSIEQRSRQLQATCLPPYLVTALEEQARERLRHPKTRLCLATHEAFGVRPTNFAAFALRHAGQFRGVARVAE